MYNQSVVYGLAATSDGHYRADAEDAQDVKAQLVPNV